MGRARLARRATELSESKNLAKITASRKVPKVNPSVLQRDAVAILVFLALTAIMTNPLLLHFTNAVEDTQDALLNTWIIGWVGHALITNPLNLFNANIFYPYPNALAFSETMLPQGLFALPFNLAFDNTILGYNLVLLASFFLAAYAMYIFILDLTRSRGAAIVAGTIFAFNPYNLGNLAQVQLLSFGWLPLAMMYFRRMINQSVASRQLRDFSRFPTYFSRDLILFTIFFSLQALSSFYYAFFAGFAILLYIIWDFAVHSLRISAFVRILISFVIIAIVVVPFFLPYLQVQRDLGFQRNLAESEPFSASFTLYTKVSPQNVLYGSLLALRPPIIHGGYPLDNLFPGIIALALAIIGIAATNNRERWFYFLLLAFAFVLSLGPRLFITPNVGTDITLPYQWLYDLLPLLHALRAPVRFDALVMFAIAVLAGLGTLAIRNSPLTIRIKRYELQIATMLVPLIALEYLALPAANITPVPTGSTVPQYVRWLAKQPHGVILELPMIMGEPGKLLDLTRQYLSTYDWQQTPDGYSGFVPPLRGEIAYELQSFPNERSISLLQALGVEYVVIHSDKMKIQDIRSTDLQLAQQYGADQIYRVAPRAQDASALTTRLYLPPTAAPHQIYFAYVVVENHAARSFAITPTDMPQVDARWSDGTSQRVTATMPLVTSSISIVQVQLVAPPRTGDYHLDMRVSGNAIGEWDLAGDVVVKNEEPVHQVVLPAQIFLKSPLLPAYTPGNTVSADLVWLAQNKIDAYYSASVRVVDAQGNKVVNVDRQPVVPTLLWTPGSTIPDQFTLTLPRDLAPGEYSLQMLMYQADQGVDALLLDAQFVPRSTITLGTFTVKQ